MKRLKILSIILYILLASFTLSALYASQNAITPTLCQNALFRAFMPWDSACFYRALYKNNNTARDLIYEQRKLDYFMKRNGFSHAVLWYRSLFHQRFKDYLKVSFDEIDQMHWDYTVADPSKVEVQLAYIQFLINNNKNSRAQNSLNRYCKVYLKPAQKYIVEGIEERFAEKKMDLSTTFCWESINNKSLN